MPERARRLVIRAHRLGEYFHHAVHATAAQRRLAADQATLHYLVLLLCQNARSEQLFDYDDGRLQIRPLALLYEEAQEARSPRERRLWLQRLGDLALMVGGLFAGRTNRHFKDLDYCCAMGGSAYDYLGQTARGTEEKALAQIFGELADDFGQFVELVAIVTGQGQRAQVGNIGNPGLH